MAATPNPESCYEHRIHRRVLRWFVLTFVLGALSIGLSVTIDSVGKLPDGLRYAAAAAAAALMLFWIRASIRVQRSLDELHRRVFLEATSIIGIAAIGWVYLFPVLEKTGFVRPITHDGYAITVLPLAVIAWLLTRRRYR